MADPSKLTIEETAEIQEQFAQVGAIIPCNYCAMCPRNFCARFKVRQAWIFRVGITQIGKTWHRQKHVGIFRVFDVQVSVFCVFGLPLRAPLKPLPFSPKRYVRGYNLLTMNLLMAII